MMRQAGMLLLLALLLDRTVNLGRAADISEAAPAQNHIDSWPWYALHAETNWQLNLPRGERFDPSGLFRRDNGELLTVSDQHEGVYKIEFLPGTNAADVVQLPDCFSKEQLRPFAAEKFDRYDCEGVCEDGTGRIYICEEANRWILRWDPSTHKVERLDIDWAPVEKYFHPTDRNASFEGVAVHNQTLYVANERQEGRIIVVDLRTLTVTDDFSVRPRYSRAKDIHFSDLCWFNGSLFALLRENHVIVRINPETKNITAEYDYSAVEKNWDVVYEQKYPIVSAMEGLAVDNEYFWLCVDNNGHARRKYPEDRRPTLFKCRRPDANQ